MLEIKPDALQVLSVIILKESRLSVLVVRFLLIKELSWSTINASIRVRNRINVSFAHLLSLSDQISLDIVVFSLVKSL